MQRYFLTAPYNEQTIVLSGDDFHHLYKVMRMKEGDRIYTVFPDGRTARSVLTGMKESYAEAEVEEWLEQTPEMPVQVVLACGLVKGDKFDYIIQKGTELGAAGFIPFEADRSVVKWDRKKGTKKTERWQKIAKEAAEQSHRSCLPFVDEPVTIGQMIEAAKDFDVKLFAYEETAKKGEMPALFEAVASLQSKQRMIVVIGPEGGFSDKEAAMLTKNGFSACALGPRILRAETAPLYVLSAVSFYLELKR